ncbi:MAG: LacI family DNA-binding transcriptional regulator [Tropicimonas sp.]|uniref:LacI family DNA-binding transcriptional regulator n=1 Tax=Tropicimonas sp. TaxID=2067044 RepID=UPI003A853D74
MFDTRQIAALGRVWHRTRVPDIPTQRDIARLTKTSLKTVSRVINNDPLVNEKTRKRIQEVIEQTGYVPNQAARMMRSQRSDVIGFLSEDVATTSSSIDLVRGAQEVAHERGKQMMLFNICLGEQSEQDALEQLARFRAEACILATSFHRAVMPLDAGTPTVLLNCFDSRETAPTVLPDDYRLGFDLTCEIIRRGYRRPLFLNLAPELEGARLRAAGFTDAARDAGLDFGTRISTASASPETPHAYFVDAILPAAMRGAEAPDILICGQDLMALSVYFCLSALGLTPGKDVAIASFDNLQPLARLMQPGLSTMDLPYLEMGRAAMTMAIDGADPGERRLVRGRLVERGSM